MYKSLKVSQETHTLIKVAAAKAGITIEEFLNKLIKGL